MLRLECATNFAIPAHVEGANLRNLHWLTDNADGLLWVPPGLDWHPIKFELHSLREGILTFAALAQYRNNAWAHQAGRKYLESIRRGLKPDFTWDFDQFDYARYFTGGENEDPGHKPSNEGRFALTVQHGRCIEALVWYYEATGDALAMELAEDLARFHLAYAIAPDGTIPDELAHRAIGDRQSHLYTLCGLLLFGCKTHQSEYVDAVVRTYRAGVPALVNECGWVAHDMGQTRFPDQSGNLMANTESTGAAARLALWMARYTAHTECYDDVERLVRARLFPGQITPADIHANPDLEIPPRALGGWGGNDYPHAGKGYNPSGTAEIVHTMCAIYQHISALEEAGLVVYMHFDYADDAVEIKADRSAEATLAVRPRIHDNVLIRVPGWAPPESVRIEVDGRPVALRMVGSFAYLGRQQLGRQQPDRPAPCPANPPHARDHGGRRHLPLCLARRPDHRRAPERVAPAVLSDARVSLAAVRRLLRPAASGWDSLPVPRSTYYRACWARQSPSAAYWDRRKKDAPTRAARPSPPRPSSRPRQWGQPRPGGTQWPAPSACARPCWAKCRGKRGG